MTDVQEHLLEETPVVGTQIVDVAVPYRVPRSFHYRVDSDLVQALKPGSVIQVPFRSRSTYGFVLGFPSEPEVDLGRLKRVEDVLVAEPIFDAVTLKFLRWVADYYCHPLGEVLAVAAPKQYWKLTGKQKARAAELARSESFLRKMGLLGHGEVPRPPLTEEQSFAVARILDPQDSRPVLLHGVTGSGKTEVYMSVLDRVIGQGKTAIVLVPEIALTPQLVGRFAGRFPGQVAILHSDLTPRERYVQWERLRTGLARVVVGARSAVFAPLTNLGLVVVDEEHETSYKQEDSLRYHARDLAVVRGRFSGAKVILGSATPSLESYWNAQNEKYCYVTLKKRVQDRPLPKTILVDLREEADWYSPQHSWLSRELVNRLQATLAREQQAMLFLNRLGYAHFLFCKECGHTWRCPNCDVSLTFYRNPRQLKCHCCAYTATPPTVCQECEGVRLETLGLGTEQVERALAEILPQARILRMDRSVVKTRQDLETVLGTISRREVDIVVGTQMIAKGHDFPGIALVGILLADASLNFPDFRAFERTFQTVTQVSGRAGRADIAGEVVIQTLNPDHPVLVAAAENRVMDFYRMELSQRKQFCYPPFSRTAMLRFQHRSLSQVETFAQDLATRIREFGPRLGYHCSVLGPVEAPIARIKNLYRWHCLLKGDSVRDLQKALQLAQEYWSHCKTPVQMAVDMDPISSL